MFAPLKTLTVIASPSSSLKICKPIFDDPEPVETTSPLIVAETEPPNLFTISTPSLPPDAPDTVTEILLPVLLS